jgi:hypothetical protein
MLWHAAEDYPNDKIYKRILKERTVGKKAAGRNNTPGSGS